MLRLYRLQNKFNIQTKGKYIPFLYSLLNTNYIRAYVIVEETHFIPLTIPPAYVFICSH